MSVIIQKTVFLKRKLVIIDGHFLLLIHVIYRNSSLINQVQAKKVQLKKATKHAEATDTDNEELQDRCQFSFPMKYL